MSWIWTPLAAVRWTWESRKEITTNLKLVRQWFNKPSRILIIGPGGTGKTTLAKILSGNFDWLLDEPWEYVRSLETETVKFKNRNVEAFVAPGQKLSRTITWGHLLEDLRKGKYRGVILVSSYGYHSLPSQGMKVAKPGMHKRRAIEEFRSDAMRDEIVVARDVANAITECVKKVWLLSVVTKEDIWRDQSNDVRTHYTTGEHGLTFAALQNHRGSHSLAFDVAFTSLVIAKWVTPKGEVLAKNLEGYDQRDQVNSLKDLFQRLDALRKWEGKA